MKTLFDTLDLNDLSLKDIIDGSYVMIDKTKQSILYKGLDKFRELKNKWIKGGWILDTVDLDYPSVFRELFFIKGKSVFSVFIEAGSSDNIDSLTFYLASVSSRKYFGELQEFYKARENKKREWHIKNEMQCFGKAYIEEL